ncbi:uncharacterized protein LOC133885598 [Phragmites australis]|uniref:uncharacterized protein LOC133885598 n=1 Tax=Phragmites australis TaxID=29695 RepID=UPI002D77BACB|nr:uncharacterized protein LOC133885598 [Phragmites australis]XP_062181311.1 uncharacterized protein LOC133885598 [Phragmites australis]
MAAAPVMNGNNNDVDSKARNVVVKSEIVDTVNGEDDVPQHTVPACTDPMVTFGSLGNMVADDVQFAYDEHGDSTECSSSFSASCSVSDDDMESATSAMEVDSLFHSHINVDDTTAVPHSVRKKKVTAEWRKFIGPEMWRCKWLELRMKDLLSQVAKYDKELALINHEKDLQLEMIKADSPESEWPQIALQSHESNTMKRRKRKRHEDIMDTSLYAERHQILSYYHEKQKKKTETDEVLDDDDSNSLAVENTIRSLGSNDTLLESKENDTILEQYSLRDILSSIDGIQSRIISLQNHISEAQNNVDHSQKTQKAQKKKDMHSFLRKKDMGRPLGAASSILSDRSTDRVMEYVKRNIVEPGAVDITQQDDEITVEMLFGVDNPLIDARIGGLYKESADDVLIDNQAAREEGYWLFERVSQTAETQPELVKNVAGHPSSKEVKTSAQVGDDLVSRTAPIVKLVNKRGPKPKKKHDSTLPRTEDQIEKSHTIHTKKKKTEKDLNNAYIEKTMLVAVDTRRSHRVRKPKIY